MMDHFNEEAQQYLDDFGFVILQNVLSEQEVENIREIIIKIAAFEREQGQACLYGDNKHQRIWNLINKHEIFRETIQKPQIIQVMRHLFGDSLYLHSWTVNMIGGEGGEGEIHTDNTSPLTEPLPPFPIKANSIWVLDEFTEYNGATMCVPGSHKFLRHPKSEEGHRPDLIKLLAPKGAVVITHGALWHKSGLNQTSGSRIAMLGSFGHGFIRSQEDHLQNIDAAVIEEASPLLKQLLGVGYGIYEGAKLKPPF